MSDTITSLPLASTIDATQDWLAIDTTSLVSTQRINRNTFLNLGSAPVGLTDSQTLTNKILTSPTISGPTLSGTLIGTYTLGGTPTFPASVVTLTGSQTLTNKVLTSPTINSPTITNATINADAITGFTTSNSGTVYGVPVTTGAISNSSAFGSGVILPSALLAGTGSSWAWQSWTPVWSNLTIGNATVNGYYLQIGKTVVFNLNVILGSTTVVAVASGFSLPVNNNTTTYTTSGSLHNFIGSGYANPAGANELVFASIDSTLGANIARLFSLVSSQPTPITATSPATWASTNVLQISGMYQAA